MNIFVLDENVELCARYHCDQHVGKMVLESTQILCTVLNLKGFTTPYRSTHSKHPCVIWAAESYDNFTWLFCLAQALNREFCWRYKRSEDHASVAVLKEISQHRFSPTGLSPFVQAMPERYKTPNNAVEAYRAFYCADKSRFATWKRREAPFWFTPENNGLAT